MRTVRSSSIAFQPNDVVFLVLDDLGAVGKAYRETDPAEADEQRIIEKMLSGEYSRPQKVVAFSLTGDWARDLTVDVALKVLDLALQRGVTLPRSTRELIERELDTEVPAQVRGD